MGGCWVLFSRSNFGTYFGSLLGPILGSKSRPEGPDWHQKGTKRAPRGPKAAKEATCRKHRPQQRKRHFGVVSGPPFAPSWAALGPQKGTRRLKESIAERDPKRDPKWTPKWTQKGPRIGPTHAHTQAQTHMHAHNFYYLSCASTRNAK